MGKIQGKMDSDFTMVHNAFVKDSRLNSSEKGILLVMLQKPVGYRFTVRGLASEMRDGVTSITASLNNLKRFGYVRDKRVIINGRFGPNDYEYSDEPIFKTEFNDPAIDNPNHRCYEDLMNDIEKADIDKTDTSVPYTDNPNMDAPHKGKPYDYISTKRVSTERIRTKEIKKEKPKVSKPDKQKKQYAEAVYMTETEYQTLCEKHSKDFADRCIEVLNNYKLSKGKFYRSDYHAILSWVEKKVLEDIAKSNGNNNQPLSVSMPVKTDPNENPFTKFLNESGGA